MYQTNAAYGAGDAENTGPYCNLCTKERGRGTPGVERGTADKKHMHYLKTKVKNAH